jgi:hypothetical protein
MSFEEIQYVDTFYPTKEQFSKFEMYVESLSKISKSGIFKVNFI